jgi:hypothetical protein
MTCLNENSGASARADPDGYPGPLLARTTIMILAVLCTRRSLAEIGPLLNRDYTTVCHALCKRCGITVDTRLSQLSTGSRRGA